MFLRNWARLYSSPTVAELAIEPAIAGLGKRYRAQHPFFGMWHVADFALIDDRVIIEVDGASHSRPDQITKDLVHTIKLMKLGWRVVRCTNEEAIGHPDVTVSELLGARLSHHPTLAELEARLLALYPDGLPARPKRRARKKSPAPASSVKKRTRAAKGPPKVR